MGNHAEIHGNRDVCALAREAQGWGSPEEGHLTWRGVLESSFRVDQRAILQSAVYLQGVWGKAGSKETGGTGTTPRPGPKAWVSPRQGWGALEVLYIVGDKVRTPMFPCFKRPVLREAGAGVGSERENVLA